MSLEKAVEPPGHKMHLGSFSFPSRPQGEATCACVEVSALTFPMARGGHLYA